VVRLSPVVVRVDESLRPTSRSRRSPSPFPHPTQS
jgi:hypothetical protein